MKLALRSVLRRRQRRAIILRMLDGWRTNWDSSFGDLAEVRPIPFGVDNPAVLEVRSLLPTNPRRWLAVTRLTKNKIGDLFSWGEGLFGENWPEQVQLSVFAEPDLHPRKIIILFFVSRVTAAPRRRLSTMDAKESNGPRRDRRTSVPTSSYPSSIQGDRSALAPSARTLSHAEQRSRKS